MLWGLVVVNPYSNCFTTSPTFSALAQIASEAAWGASFLFIGLFGLIASRYGNGTVITRRFILISNMFGWITLTIFYYLGNPYSTGWVAYFIIAMAALIAFIEAK
jgi:hypothetical protein